MCRASRPSADRRPLNPTRPPPNSPSSETINARLSLPLTLADSIIQLQKKVAELLLIPLSPEPERAFTHAVSSLSPASLIYHLILCSTPSFSIHSCNFPLIPLTSPLSITLPPSSSNASFTTPQQQVLATSAARDALRQPRTAEFTPPCSMKASISALCAPCIACSLTTTSSRTPPPARHPLIKSPSYSPTPNPVWSCDITKLMRPTK